ncbi:MAG: maltotransferase domain-containing protein, partial [Desulfomonilaceae bacterium]
MTDPPPARVVIENIRPIVECGRFSAKRVSGDRVV